MRNPIRARSPQPGTVAATYGEADLREAYARGRRDERARRRRAPMTMLTLSLVALAGSGILAISAWQGAFAGSGAAVDEKIAYAAVAAEPRLRDAADDAKDALARASAQARTRAHGLIGG